MASALALGATPPSQEVAGLGEESFFPEHRQTHFGLCVFNGTLDDKPIWRRLAYAGETKIRRYVKIRQTANPFDPQWKADFKERAFFNKSGFACQQAGIELS